MIFKLVKQFVEKLLLPWLSQSPDWNLINAESFPLYPVLTPPNHLQNCSNNRFLLKNWFNQPTPWVGLVEPIFGPILEFLTQPTISSSNRSSEIFKLNGNHCTKKYCFKLQHKFLRGWRIFCDQAWFSLKNKVFCRLKLASQKFSSKTSWKMGRGGGKRERKGDTWI